MSTCNDFSCARQANLGISEQLTAISQISVSSYLILFYVQEGILTPWVNARNFKILPRQWTNIFMTWQPRTLINYNVFMWVMVNSTIFTNFYSAKYYYEFIIIVFSQSLCFFICFLTLCYSLLSWLLRPKRCDYNHPLGQILLFVTILRKRYGVMTQYATRYHLATCRIAGPFLLVHKIEKPNIEQKKSIKCYISAMGLSLDNVNSDSDLFIYC